MYMCKDIKSLAINRVKGDAKQFNIDVNLADGKQFTVLLTLASGDVYINPLKVFREYKRYYPKTRLTMRSRLFKSVVREVASAWKTKFRQGKSSPAIHH
jgi:hypothetical protein